MEFIDFVEDGEEHDLVIADIELRGVVEVEEAGSGYTERYKSQRERESGEEEVDEPPAAKLTIEAYLDTETWDEFNELRERDDPFPVAVGPFVFEMMGIVRLERRVEGEYPEANHVILELQEFREVVVNRMSITDTIGIPGDPGGAGEWAGDGVPPPIDADDTGHVAGVSPATTDAYVDGTTVLDDEGGSTISTHGSFEAALNSAMQTAGSGGSVVLAPGTHTISQTNTVTMVDGVSVYGRGQARIVWDHPGQGSSEDTAIYIRERDGWRLDGIDFEGSSNQNYSSIISDERNVPPKYDIAITSCTFRNSTYVAINFDNVYNSVIDNCYFQNPTLYNGSGWGGFAIREHSCEDCVIRNSIIDSTGVGAGQPLHSGLTMDGRDNLIEGVVVRANGGEQFGAMEVKEDGPFESRNTVRNCEIYGPGSGTGFNHHNATGGSTYTLESNVIEGFNVGYDDTQSAGGNTLRNNTFRNNGQDVRTHATTSVM